MADRLWTTPEPEDELAGWRPERPEPARPADDPGSRDAEPTRELPPLTRASEAPTEPIDVVSAAARVRGVLPPDEADEPAGRRRRRRRTDPAAAAPAAAAASVHEAPTEPQGPLDVTEAARRVRDRRAAASGGDGGSPFSARSRPAPAVAPPPARRTWLAPFLSALVGALAVVVVFLLLFRGGGDGSPDPLPATAGPGGGQANVRAIYARASHSVVSVVARMSSGRATGTGFLVGARDTIVTNAHVVGTAREVQVRFGDDGRLLDAEVLGRDVSTDLAVLRVDPGLHTGNPLPLADSDDVRVGDAVVAIGNPFGLDRTATAGIVSATDRHISAPNGFDIDDVIQTDAPINPGNSGGPLLDARGRVIGVNSQIATSGGGGGNVGIGFAVPSNTLRDVVPQLEQGKRIRRAYLGVSTTTGDRGARVAEVTPSGPADTGGIRVGDDIIRVGGRAVNDSDDLGSVVQEFRPGDTVEVEVVRNGVERTIDVRLGTRPGG